jgi:hypothetical protein
MKYILIPFLILIIINDDCIIDYNYEKESILKEELHTKTNDFLADTSYFQIMMLKVSRKNKTI